MADKRLPLLRARITSVDTYEAPRSGRGAPKLPSLDPKAHAAALMQQLDAILHRVAARSKDARDELATREIVAVRPAAGARLAAEQLDDSRADARLVGVMQDTGVVILDVSTPDLEYLRKKVDAFADDAREGIKTSEDGTVTKHRAGERAIAPIGDIGLADLGDLSGAQLRAEAPPADRPCWFEIGCRGGYRSPPEQTSNSRGQIARQLHRLGLLQKLDDFEGPERVYFFLRLTTAQLDDLRRATDCIVEFDLAPPPLRDLKLFEDLVTKDVAEFALGKPPEGAPAVVVLDTGIATGHPLLRSAILSATTAGHEIPSPEDTYGHGTKMAGLALHHDLGAAIEAGGVDAAHWLQSSRLLIEPGHGTASDENCEKWPVLTERAVRSAEEADPGSRKRAFVLAVTRSMQDPPLDGISPTLWSHAIDKLAYGGRLMIVAGGNAREGHWLRLAEQHPQLQLSEKIHQPAQAVNALTVGAFTARLELPNDKRYAEARVIATKPGGISPYTSVGPAGKEWPIKPDVVLEGGNLAIAGTFADPSVATLSALTTSHLHTYGKPLGLLSMTSEASARAARLAARIWSLEPDLRPETIRGLIVHSARWTKAMMEDFSGLNDRLLACGYGVPNERLATECAQGVATIVIEDSMPNAVAEEVPKATPPVRPTTKTTETKYRRKLKLYRLPLPDRLLTNDDPDVELRVTLSYFPEPNQFGRRTHHGLDLKWDMQGPQESEDAFKQRINALLRPTDANGKRSKALKTESFTWAIGIDRRSRSSVQSDHWKGKMSELVGDKLIAVYPVLGWWDQRKALKTQEMSFSLVISVFGQGIYEVIRPSVEASAPMIEV